MKLCAVQFSQAYVLLKSMQAATAVKKKIETFGEGQQYAKKFTVGYSNPYTNPFKTLPKDGPMRTNASANSNRTNGGPMQSYSGGSYRGSRGGGYNNRGGGVNNASNYSRGGFQQSVNGFQGSGIGGFSSMGGIQTYGGYQGRGSMMSGIRGGGMGMRGGRGGMMGMPMNIGLGAMGMGIPMPQMGSMGMQGMPYYPHVCFCHARLWVNIILPSKQPPCLQPVLHALLPTLVGMSKYANILPLQAQMAFTAPRLITTPPCSIRNSKHHKFTEAATLLTAQNV